MVFNVFCRWAMGGPLGGFMGRVCIYLGLGICTYKCICLEVIWIVM